MKLNEKYKQLKKYIIYRKSIKINYEVLLPTSLMFKVEIKNKKTKFIRLIYSLTK